MPTCMLVTCGTSVLTHGEDEPTRQRCQGLANLCHLDAADQAWLAGLTARASRRLTQASPLVARSLSAEVNSVAAWFAGPSPATGQPDILILLHTDTALGRSAAELLADWFHGQGFATHLHTESGLATRSLLDFQQSLADLVRWAWTVLPGYRSAGYRIVFNLTGGFKGILAVLQVMATFMADETVYLFQGSQDLMTIPRLPVRLATEETVRQHLQAFRGMAVLGSVPHGGCTGLPETLYFAHDGQAGLTAWGEIVWREARDAFYKGGLLEPLSLRIRFGEAFRRAAASLAPDRLLVLNENVDQLARMLESPENPNPRSLHFHKLTRPTEDGCTHEFYASSEGGAPRCYVREEGGAFLVARYGAHL